MSGEASRKPAAVEKVTKVLSSSKNAAISVFEDFKNFINKGSVVDLAVGIIMGAAFTAIVNSIVKDLIGPIIGLAVGDSLDNAFVTLRCPKGTKAPCPFPSLSAATAAGVVTLNYGPFLQVTINFIIISIIVFFLVKMYTAAFRRAPAEKTKKTCQFCCNDIPIKATRCGFCTSPLDYEG